MADVDKYLAKILSAVYGEEVRGSIHDAIQAMNVEATEAYDTAVTAKDSAAASATAAKTSEDNAKVSETNAKTSEDNAKVSETNAKTSEDNALISEANAKISEDNSLEARQYISNIIQGFDNRVDAGKQTIDDWTASKETVIAEFASDTIEQMTQLKDNAAASATSAANSEDSAALSSQSAASSVTAARDYMTGAESAANEAEDHATTATNQALAAAESARKAQQALEQLERALIAKGTIVFEDLPITGMQTGWMYNISNAFTTDSRFKDGSGIKYNPGNNVYYTEDGYWDVLASESSIVVVDSVLDEESQNPIQNGTVTKELAKVSGLPVGSITGYSGTTAPAGYEIYDASTSKWDDIWKQILDADFEKYDARMSSSEMIYDCGFIVYSPILHLCSISIGALDVNIIAPGWYDLMHNLPKTLQYDYQQGGSFDHDQSQMGILVDVSTNTSYEVFISENGLLRIDARHAEANSTLRLSGSLTYVYSEFEEV